jgi:hypothetical protein
MKVKDLIKKLKECDPDATVITASSNFELNGADVEVDFVHQSNEGSVEERTFTDAFDYENYTKEVWFIHGGSTPVVYIS